MSKAYAIAGKPGAGTGTVINILQEILGKGEKETTNDYTITRITDVEHVEELERQGYDVTLVWVAATDETREERVDGSMPEWDLDDVRVEHDVSLINEGSKEMLQMQVERVIQETHPRD